jgi:hypothetical protein
MRQSRGKEHGSASGEAAAGDGVLAHNRIGKRSGRGMIRRHTADDRGAGTRDCLGSEHNRDHAGANEESRDPSQEEETETASA